MNKILLILFLTVSFSCQAQFPGLNRNYGGDGWDLSDFTYITEYNVNTQEPNPTDVTFFTDGTQMFVVGFTNRRVQEYTLSTGWDVSTSTFLQNTSVATWETTPQGLWIKADGTKMYIAGSGGDEVNEFTLVTPWDITSKVFVQNKSVITETDYASGLFFNSDGSIVWISDEIGDDIDEYALSTGWDISTMTYTESFDVSTYSELAQDVYFNPFGTQMWVLNLNSTQGIVEYSLSTPWDISTSAYVQFIDLSVDVTAALGIYINFDLNKFYIADRTQDVIHEYDF